MSQTARIREIIEEARHHATGPIFLDNLVRGRLGEDASEDDAESAIAFCREILDAVPVLLDRVREAAETHGVSYFIEPMLTHAENYFVNPTDHLSEILFGERGLLDDAYLALSIIQLVTTGSDPLIRIDLDPPLRFLEQLNPTLLPELQAEKSKAVEAMLEAMQAFGEAAAQKTEQRRRAEAAARQPARPKEPPPRSGTATVRRQCGACSGMGSVTCSSCGGYGSHTQSYTRIDWQGNTEYVNESVPCSCAGGRVTCGTCGGSGSL